MSKAILITGGARGIGATTARTFASNGHRVVIGDIDADLVAKTAIEIARDTGVTVVGLPVDVTDVAPFEELLSAAERELGGLDVLVNNAGIMPTGAFLDESLEVADRQFAINVRGVIIGSKPAAASPHVATGTSSTSPRSPAWSPHPAWPPTARPNTPSSASAPRYTRNSLRMACV